MTNDGLVVVDKPTGWTSHDVVGKLRRVYGIKRVGHAGTLDPDATGVLLVGVGRVTRLLRFLQVAGKTYRATVAFGVATDTLDAAGSVIEQAPMSCTEDDLAAVLPRFIGDIDQVPPMVSALKVGGRKLYELARAGKTIELAPRRVHIESIEVLEFLPGAYPVATLEVRCGSGTYIRSLAADLGAALGGLAHLHTLRRLRVGRFTLDDARPIEAIEADPAAALRSPAAALGHLPRLEVDAEVARGVSHGVVFPISAIRDHAPGDSLATLDPDAAVALLDTSGVLLAVYERRGASLEPAVVLASSGGGP